MSMLIEGSPELAYCTVATPTSWTEMNPSCIGSEHVRAGHRIRSGVAEAGDQVTQYTLQDGRLVTARWEVVDAELGREFRMREIDTGTVVRWTFTPEDGRTRADRESSGTDWTSANGAALTALRDLITEQHASLGAPVARNRGTGTLTEYYTETTEQVVGRAETGGALAAMRSTVRPESAPPLHIHTREDESWIVLSGVVRFWFGERTLAACETVDIEAGGYVFGPRFVPHTFKSLTPESEVIVTNSPGTIEGYFDSIGPAAAREDDLHTDLFARYGLILFGDQVPG
ncbi:cupin domain-containing protein [Nocardia sp. NEAU-G5]|uniref:Cupin domain-containing protein n=1 Tax=Nocardia albiluteola TaxID=2842303 RepID=A0ABS6BAI9_9NOCA|nr:cupin domain-containing protein [Nocardia albiluteola]MBU3067317.1 cupin domain-containing protein [Nocardia albiluteola]